MITVTKIEGIIVFEINYRIPRTMDDKTQSGCTQCVNNHLTTEFLKKSK